MQSINPYNTKYPILLEYILKQNRIYGIENNKLECLLKVIVEVNINGISFVF